VGEAARGIVSIRPIGFGIGAGKCDTRRFTRGTGKRGIFGTLPEADALSIGIACGGKSGPAVRAGIEPRIKIACRPSTVRAETEWAGTQD
jgi:hypothetical protein